MYSRDCFLRPSSQFSKTWSFCKPACFFMEKKIRYRVDANSWASEWKPNQPVCSVCESLVYTYLFTHWIMQWNMHCIMQKARVLHQHFWPFNGRRLRPACTRASRRAPNLTKRPRRRSPTGTSSTTPRTPSTLTATGRRSISSSERGKNTCLEKNKNIFSKEAGFGQSLVLV